MGFGEDTLRAANPGLIYVSISGFGEQGPYAHTRVMIPIQALSGATDIQADRITGKPQMFRIIPADKVTSLTVSIHQLGAVRPGTKWGRPAYRLSMLDTLLSFFWPEAMTGLTFAEREFDVSKLGVRWT